MAGEVTSQPPPSPITSTEALHMVSSVKLPILNKGEYILWTMKMEQYLAHIDYALWEVILNERKAKTTLLMAIPDEHLARFYGIKDAKTLWAAIKTKFSGNAESKKMQKIVLKHQFEKNFVSNSEGLDKGYDRFQRLLSLLEIHGAESTSNTNELNVAYSVSTATGYSSQAQEEEVTETMFDNRSSDEENSLANDRFKKGEGYHAVPPPFTGNYMPPKSNLSFVGLDDSIYKFKISEKVTSLTKDEKVAPETSTACEEKPKEDRSSAPLFQDWDTDSDNDNRMAKKFVLPNNVGKGTGHKESRPVWNNIQRINYQNKFAPTTVFARVNTAGSKAVSVVKGNGVTTIKTSAVYLWRPRVNEIDQISKDNRALVTNHYKNPYELLNGRTPRLDFMRPFGSHVTIFNTLDPLGKSKGKANKGFLLGNQTDKNASPHDTNGNAGTQDNVDVGKEVSDQHYIVLPLWPSISSTFKSSDDKAADDKPKDDTGSKTVEEPVNTKDQAYKDKLDRLMSQEKEASDVVDALRKEFEQGCMDQREAIKAGNTNSFNTVSNPVNAACTLGTFSAGGPSSPHPDDTAELRNTGIFNSAYDDDLDIFTSPVQSMGAEADFNNMDSSTVISPIPTHRVHIDHPKDQILRDLKLAVQTKGDGKEEFWST
nr:ribonuclease H-like domain-containing protein [Tanacetum cinerariifolium]